MLPITSFPRRFTTAHKRMLHALASAQAATRASSAVSSSLHGPAGRLSVASPLSTLAGSSREALLTKTSPLPSNNSQLGHVRDVQTKTPSSPAATTPTGAQRQNFATAAASAAVDDDDDDEDDDSYLYGPRGDHWFTTSRDPRHDTSFPGRDPATGRLHSVAMPNLKSCSREQMLNYFDNTWALTDALFSTLQGEHAFTTPPPHQLRHPLIFYYGHPTCFFINKLVVSGLLNEPLNPYFEQVFEVGVDEMRWDDMSKNEMHWPSVAEVTEYRHTVYKMVRGLIQSHPGLEPDHAAIDESNELWALCMALEHDRIHLETSSMLMLEHPVEFFAKSDLLADYHESAYRPTTTKRPTVGVDYPQNELLPVAGATVALGKPRDFPTFGWDNEYGSKQVEVPACEASKFLISNGEFYEFVSSGGYLEPSYWSSLGWEWRCFRNTKWPQFWVPNGPSGSHQFKLRAIFDVLPMQWDWPAQVNFHEAQAFCKWKNERDGNADDVVYHLTTEPIHQLLRDAKDRASCENESDDVLTVATKMASECGKNLNLSHASFTPVDAMKPTESGFHDVFGNAWEWCEDTFNALPGFKLHKYYDDFSAPCFDGEHQIIMGGSFISTGDNGASKFARYHFRPHFFQHAGFRVVAQPVDNKSQSYTLATSCVEAPGPFTKPTNPYRTTATVPLASTATRELTAEMKSHEALFDEIYRKSESALELFVASLGGGNDSAVHKTKTLLVRSGAAGALKLKDQLHSGDVMVVVGDDGAAATTAQLATQLQSDGAFKLVQSGSVPVFTKHSAKEVRVVIQDATAWKKQ